jgi:hypothetical protein
MTTRLRGAHKSAASREGTSHRRRAIRLGATATAVLGAALAVGVSGAASASAGSSLGGYIQQNVNPSSVSGQATIDVVAYAPYDNANLLVTDSLSSGTIVSVSPNDVGMACSPPGGTRVTCQENPVPLGQQVGFEMVVRGTAAASATSTAEVAGLQTAFRDLNIVTTVFPSTYQLSVNETATPGPKNGQATVTASIHNSGPDPASGVTLENLIKAGGFQGATLTSDLPTSCPFVPPPAGYNGDLQCSLQRLAALATWKLVFTFTGNYGAALVDNKAVGSTTIDTVNGSASSGISTFLAPTADLVVYQRIATGSTQGHADFSVVIKNNGPAVALNLTLYDQGTEPLAGYPTSIAIPTMATQVRNSTCNGWYCHLASLAPGESWTVTVDFAGTSGARVGNTATISATSPTDPAPGNNATQVLFTTFM